MKTTIAILALVLVGCVDTLVDPVAVSCTEVGCESGITVRLTTPLEPGDYDVTICVDDICSSAQVTIGADGSRSSNPDLRPFPSGFFLTIGGLSEADDVPVSVDISRGGDSPASFEHRSEGAVAIRRVMPNGPDCPPVCFQGEVVL